MTAIYKLLANSDIAAIRYRTLKELFELPERDDLLQKAFTEVEESKEAKNIFKKMHPDGYWLQTNPRTKITVGKGVEYGSYATTHFAIGYLAELGFTRLHPTIDKVVNRYLDLIAPDGDWWNHMSCLYGYNIRNLVRMGYRNDERLQKAIDLMIRSIRHDGGYLCDMHEKKAKRKPKKSCYRGALKVLMALSELPEYHQTKTCQALLTYFLNREAIYNSKKTAYVTKEMGHNTYPISWGANTYEVLLSLSKMGYGQHPALTKAWNLLEQKKTNSGKYILNSTHGQSLLKTGPKGEANDWITFYIELAKKHRDETKRATI